MADNTRSWTMRCIDRIPLSEGFYTINKIYEIIDLVLIGDDGSFLNLGYRDINNFEDFQNWSSAKWELVENEYAEIEKYLYK